MLTVAGSDSGGGAGIQADLKTFGALGGYGMSVVTALTAQNTVEVAGVREVDPAFVGAQLDAVLGDIGADATKVGMLASVATIRTVAERLRFHGVRNLVLDPVMVAKSGDRLLPAEAVAVLREELFPMASVVTPNIPEAEVLTGRKIDGREARMEAARRLLDLGPLAVLVKGGHAAGENCEDLLVSRSAGVEGDRQISVSDRRIESANTHGTGCTLSSAVAAFLGRGFGLEEAVREAKGYLQGAIRAGAEYELGRGHGPVHHFHRLWRDL